MNPIQGRSCDDGSRGQSDVGPSPENAGSLSKLEKAKNVFPVEPSKGMQLCQYLNVSPVRTMSDF